MNVPVIVVKFGSRAPVLATNRFMPYAPAATTYSTPSTVWILSSSVFPPVAVVAAGVEVEIVESYLNKLVPDAANSFPETGAHAMPEIFEVPILTEVDVPSVIL